MALVALSVCATTVCAQEACVTSGNIADGTGGKATYVVGQVVYNHHQSADVSMTQGVLQPYEISVVTGVENKDIVLEMIAYPNPVSDYLMLKWNTSEKLSDLQVCLYTSEGSLIKQNKVDTNPAQISMTKCIPGIYLLQVISGDKIIKTFKIIKH
nr:T9SS type A sorting domain-containing protein [uncultured Carboxylicivirga sp.]